MTGVSIILMGLTLLLSKSSRTKTILKAYMIILRLLSGSRTNQPFMKNATYSVLLLWKRLFIQIMLIDSNAKSLLKEPMDQQLNKQNKY